jgi:exonuclease SbcC
MKPLTLHIKGMYSYQEEAVIDFERLTEGRLFGIFGPVGSGKSTILEAITYALYGRSERLDKAGQSYNMMNLRSNELLIDYTFALGGEGYRFTVQFKRNSKNFEDVRTPKRVAYQDKNGEWVPLKHADGAEILGLSYENFTKTIIIPQGKFQDFLHLTPGARTQMLKELFDLDRFDLYEPANRLLSETKSQLIELEGRLSELPQVETAELREKEEERDAKTKARAEVDEKLNGLREKESEMKLVKDWVGSVGEAKETLAVLEESEPDMKKMEAELDRYEQAESAFRDLLLRSEKLKTDQVKTGKNLESFVAAEASLTEEIEKAEKQFRTTKAAWERREELKAKALEMKRISEIQQAEQEIAEVDGRVGKGKQVVVEKEAACASLRKEEIGAGEELKKQKAETRDRAELTEVKGWFKERERLQTGLQKVRAEHLQSEKEISELAGEHAELLGQVGGSSPSELVLEQGTVLRDARQALDTLRVNQRLTDFAAALEQGQACPLCGALEHPVPYDAGHADEVLLEKEAAIKSAEKEIQRLQRLETQLVAHERRQEEAQKRLESREKSLDEAQIALKKQQEAFRWPDFEKVEVKELDQQIEAALAGEKAIKLLDEKLNRIREDQRKADAELQRYREAIAEFEQKKATIQGKRETLEADLVIFSYSKYRSVPREELKAKEDFFTEEVVAIEAKYKKEDAALESYKERRGKLKTDIGVEQSRLDALSQSLAEAEDTISIRLVEMSFANREEVKKLLAHNYQVEEERRRIRDTRKELDKVRGELALLTKQLNGRSYDKEAHKVLQTSISEGESTAKSLAESIGELKNQLARMGEQLKKRLELEKQKDALQDRKNNLLELTNLFRGSGFVNYVSTMYLQELCLRANDRFRTLTRNRLSLEVRENNTFVVCDLVNGGQYRSVKTLSGGQTFQASLSLALALSDNIQNRYDSRHNLFFLDEGFGTLDRDSLSIVFDTLKELRRENRIVGVISHVEDLQQEIDLSLKVRQEEERGSLVTGSWEE